MTADESAKLYEVTRNRGSMYVKVVASTFGILMLLLLSPALLDALGAIYGDDNAYWTRISAIGQSFTGISTVLAAAALIAATVTTRSQLLQARLARGDSVRAAQRDLMTTAMNDEAVATALTGKTPTPEEYEVLKIRIFRNLLLRNHELAYLVGELDDRRVRITYRNMFTEAGYRAWWFDARASWLEAPVDSVERKFAQIVDQEYHKRCEEAANDDSADEGELT